MTPITLTAFRAESALGKIWHRDAAGNAVKTVRATLDAGKFARKEFADAEELRTYVAQLGPDVALTFGVPRDGFERGEVVLKHQRRVNGHPIIARCGEDIRYADGPGILFLDIDADHYRAVDPDEARADLVEFFPQLATVPMVIAASQSSYIWDTHANDWVSRKRGAHLYVIVQRGSDVPELAKRLIVHLWLAGRMKYTPSSVGTRLTRGLIDITMFQAERFAFSAAPECRDGLECRRQPPKAFNADAAPLSLDDVPALSDADAARVDVIKRDAKKRFDADPEVQRLREAFRKQIVQRLQSVDRSDIDERLVQRAVERLELSAQWPITLEDGTETTIAALLKEPARWHETRMRDPLEPDYRGDHRCAVFLCDGTKPPVIFSWAHGGIRYTIVPDKEAEPGGTGSSSAILVADDDALVDVNQDNVALIFAKRYGDSLRFSHDRGCWLQWEGTRWREERTRLAFEYTRQLTRSLNRSGKKEFAKSGFCEGVEKFAQSDRTFAMTGTEWDADPWLLNTPDGTVDLRTGEIRPARQTDLLTKITAVAPRRGRCTSIWLEFLKQATQGDEGMIAFLQRMAGYALTGDTREECLFFVYGPGGNGKGVFTGALFNVLGEYAMNAAMDVFLQSKGERHSTDLAMLRGARLVTASETSEGRAWDEQRLKAMTGNDPITARFMRQDNFTYLPQFKLLLVGNNKPVLRTVDDAWRRRFHVIPFTYRPTTKDITLKDRLREEYPEILAWMIDGCLDWQRNGLRPPQRVQDETAAYIESQDIFTSWLDDCCYVERERVALRSDLFRSWSAYCERNHEPAGGSRSFTDRLMARGFRRIKDEMGIRGRGFAGISIVPFSHLEPRE